MEGLSLTSPVVEAFLAHGRSNEVVLLFFCFLSLTVSSVGRTTIKETLFPIIRNGMKKKPLNGCFHS